MSSIYIVCIDDEHQVLDVLIKDLEGLEEVFPIEVASSVPEARILFAEILKSGNRIGLVVCDHIMPGEYGVDLLVEMQNKEETKATRKILLTGQAGLDDTINAVNNARLNHYIAKPWNPDYLLKVAKNELTSYVLEHEKDLLQYMRLLDSTRIQDAIRNRGYI
ncbi:MAG TPA: hypothetical protein DCM62_09900 [Bacteroidales bacterium]|nr:hypothetical protein [Bacteroidales bacterium]